MGLSSELENLDKEWSADPRVRTMPDKRNDQIESSPKEENVSPTIISKPGGEVRILNRIFLTYRFILIIFKLT
jgi:hypothetical protein